MKCFVHAESTEVSQYGNEAPGAPSLHTDSARLRDENTAYKSSAKGIDSIHRFCFYLTFVVINVCNKCFFIAGSIWKMPEAFGRCGQTE